MYLPKVGLCLVLLLELGQGQRNHIVTFRLQSENKNDFIRKVNSFGIDKNYQFGRTIIATVAKEKLNIILSSDIKHLVIGTEESTVFKISSYGLHAESMCYSQNYSNNNMWYLNRINQETALILDSDYEYYYSSHDNGRGVLTYVIDTGVFINHTDFEGRAISGFVAQGILDSGETDLDINGHGTHVAGLIGGRTFGIAKEVTIVAVKCFNQYGASVTEDVIEGLQFVFNESERNEKTKSVINMSFSSKDNSLALENIISELDWLGVVMVSASGNDYDGACFYSPGKYEQVINVGATTEDDKLAEFTNKGSCVNILAPGTNIISAGIADENATAIATGTSFAAPMVAGAAARYLSYPDFRYADPDSVRRQLLKDATWGKIDVDNVFTPNLMLFTNCTELTDTPLPPKEVNTVLIASLSVTLAVVLAVSVAGLVLFVRSKKQKKVDNISMSNKANQ